MRKGSQLFTSNDATALTPQVVTLIVDDSTSMRHPAGEGGSKAEVATKSIKLIVATAQTYSQGSTGWRYLFNIAGFGNRVTVLEEAKSPNDIDLNGILFRGSSGTTNMAAALAWGLNALEESLKKCRAIPGYREKESPPPLVVFLSDGDNTGPEIDKLTLQLRDVHHEAGKVNVVACGIGLKPEHFTVMQTIASHPELAIPIEADQLGQFLAAVNQTIVQEGPGIAEWPKLPTQPPAMPPLILPWDHQMDEGKTAFEEKRYAEAEQAFLTAVEMVKSERGGRLAESQSCLAGLYVAQGNFERAADPVDQALKAIEELGRSHDGLPAAEELAEHLTLLDLPKAGELWTRLDKLRGARPAVRAGQWAAAGFAKMAQDPEQAEQFFKQAEDAKGVGSLAATKGLLTLKRTRAGAEPYLEKLLLALEGRYGRKHPATARIYERLIDSYEESSQFEKKRQLEARSREVSNVP